MLKRNVSIFFTLLFMATITLPSILVVIDNSIDISFFYDISDEEEEKGSEKNKEVEVFLEDSNHHPLVFSDLKNNDSLDYYYKKYPKPHLNLIFSPPDFII